MHAILCYTVTVISEGAPFWPYSLRLKYYSVLRLSKLFSVFTYTRVACGLWSRHDLHIVCIMWSVENGGVFFGCNFFVDFVNWISISFC